MRRPLSLLLLAGLAGGLAPAPAGAVAPRRLQVLDPAAVERGEPDGIAVTEPATLRLAPRLREIPLRAAGRNPQPFIWCQALDSRGRLYLGTGNEGRVFRVNAAGTIEPFYQTDEIEVTALAFDSSDNLYVAAAPRGKIYRVAPDGTGELFFDSEERFIWALAFDSSGELFAATGERGILFQISADGDPRVVLDSDDPHIVSLAFGEDGTLYAGTAGRGLIYRIPVDGDVTVRHESGADEVSALAVTPDGTLYAALLQAKRPETKPERRDRRRRERPEGESPADLTVIDFQAGLPGGGPAEDEEADREPVRRASIGSRLVALSPEGWSRIVWQSDREVLYSLAAAAGSVFGGSGFPARNGGGKPPAGGSVSGFGGAIRRFDPDGDATLVARLPETQVSSLAARPARGLYAATSNMGNLYWLEPEPAESGTFTSTPIDAGLPARWGRISWTGDAPRGGRVAFSTRTGNSARPDSSWSDWSESAPDPEGHRITSPAGRFLQWRVELRGGGGVSPTVRDIRLSYQQRNVPPVVERVRVADPEPAGTADAGEADGPPSPTRAVTWTAGDPNGDETVFALELRAGEESSWTPLAAEIRESRWEWDTRSIADGLYEIRVRASDAPANPPAAALEAEARSPLFLIDHTPPRIEADAVPAAATVELTVTDNLSGVAAIRYAVDGGPWTPLFPEDGIADSGRESARIGLRDIDAGEHSVRIRAVDAHGNAASKRIDITLPP